MKHVPDMTDPVLDALASALYRSKGSVVWERADQADVDSCRERARLLMMGDLTVLTPSYPPGWRP